METKLLNYRQAAEVLGVKVSTLYSLVHRRIVPFIRLTGKSVRFDPDELRRWLDERSVPARPRNDGQYRVNAGEPPRPDGRQTDSDTFTNTTTNTN